MYVYPYGDSQQLNLDWIITKIKELEESGLGLNLEDVSDALIALKYNTSNTYAVYDYAFYNGKLYRCISGTSGSFNPAAWQEALIGNDVAILTRWINALDAAAVVDVKFDTSGTNGKIQQKYNDTYHDVVEVDYTPVQNSKRPLSSNTGYELNSKIGNISNLPSGSTDLVDAVNDLNSAISSNQLNVATVESGLTATRNYAVGDFVIVNGRLRRVIATILSGETFQSGTNIATTELASEMQMKEYQGTIDPAFTAMGADSFYLRCYTYFHTFGIVWLSFFTPAITPNTFITIGHFPSACTPSGTYSITWTGQKGGTYLIEFGSSGDVKLYCTDATPEAQFVRCYIPLLVNS